MPDKTPKNLLDIHAAHGVFPLTQMVETGLWRALSGNAKAVLGPLLWTASRRDRPSRSVVLPRFSRQSSYAAWAASSRISRSCARGLMPPRNE